MNRARVLVVEDQEAMRDLMVAGLTRRKMDVEAVGSGLEALSLLERQPVDVVVTDLRMPGLDGLLLCERMAKKYPELPVVVLSAFGTVSTAVEAMRRGAYDFVEKPVDLDVLARVLEGALARRRLQPPLRVEEVGESPALLQVLHQVERVARSDAPVLVTGESGTGKELIARRLHQQSARREGPFVAINCAAMPEALLESELFGHVAGAFTDAKAARVGLFSQANGGTLFLDEVAELPLRLQPKLLRALQERKVRPVGGDKELAFDARVVAATHQHLAQCVAQGTFREDLFYRLHVIGLSLPPLRERGQDVLLLAEHFLSRLAEREGQVPLQMSGEVKARLLAHAWPGNVRELQNCMERAVALAQGPTLRVEDLPEELQKRARSEMTDAGLPPLEEVERRHILKVLDAVRGSRTSAAQVLGLDRKTLYRKLARYSVTGEE